MLAYNENGILTEFEECDNVVVCKYCKKPYYQHTIEQIPGFRDKDYDICPYCGKVNGSSMELEYSNKEMTNNQIKKMKRK